jgi:uncharacterized membrane protein (DUF4010 family)
VILVIARTAQLYFGDTGIYVSSVLSGLVDVDAITLSLAQISQTGELELRVAAAAIVMAMTANTLAKSAMVLVGGVPALRKAILPGCILVLLTGVIVATVSL